VAVVFATAVTVTGVTVTVTGQHSSSSFNSNSNCLRLFTRFSLTVALEPRARTTLHHPPFLTCAEWAPSTVALILIQPCHQPAQKNAMDYEDSRRPSHNNRN
jgi:hypothetical protein